MKALIVWSTFESDDYLVDESFIEGYESAGGTWGGEIVKLEMNMGSASNLEYCFHLMALPYAYQQGCSVVTTNFGMGAYDRYYRTTETYYNLGILPVLPSGSNYYRTLSETQSLFRGKVTCGAGLDSNTTGYKCEFYASDPFVIVANITSITQIATEIEVTTAEANYYFGGMPVYIQGVSGYANNPNGTFVITSGGGWGATTFRVIHTLGAGSLGGSGTAQTHFQSDTAPFIAGQLAYIKDQTNLSWDDIRRKCWATGSSLGVYDTYSGYGKINITDAINASLTDTNTGTLGTMGRITLSQIADKKFQREWLISWTAVTNAYQYEIYDGNNLLGRVYAPETDYFMRIEGEKRMIDNRVSIKVRARKGDGTVSNFSNIVKIPYTQYLKLPFKSNSE